MILGSIYQGVKDFNFSRTQTSFIIYDNSVLDAKSQADIDNASLIKFDGILLYRTNQ